MKLFRGWLLAVVSPSAQGEPCRLPIRPCMLPIPIPCHTLRCCRFHAVGRRSQPHTQVATTPADAKARPLTADDLLRQAGLLQPVEEEAVEEEEDIQEVDWSRQAAEAAEEAERAALEKLPKKRAAEAAAAAAAAATAGTSPGAPEQQQQGGQQSTGDPVEELQRLQAELGATAAPNLGRPLRCAIVNNRNWHLVGGRSPACCWAAAMAAQACTCTIVSRKPMPACLALYRPCLLRLLLPCCCSCCVPPVPAHWQDHPSVHPLLPPCLFYCLPACRLAHWLCSSVLLICRMWRLGWRGRSRRQGATSPRIWPTMPLASRRALALKVFHTLLSWHQLSLMAALSHLVRHATLHCSDALLQPALRLPLLAMLPGGSLAVCHAPWLKHIRRT